MKSGDGCFRILSTFTLRPSLYIIRDKYILYYLLFFLDPHIKIFAIDLINICWSTVPGNLSDLGYIFLPQGTS